MKIKLVLVFLALNYMNRVYSIPSLCMTTKEYSKDSKDQRKTNFGFSFFNKGYVPLNITVENESISQYKQLFPISSNSNSLSLKAAKGKRYNIKLDISKPTTLRIQDNTLTHIYKFVPNKTIYVTWKGILYPQTGPHSGKYNITEDCFSKSQNVICAVGSTSCDWNTETLYNSRK